MNIQVFADLQSLNEQLLERWKDWTEQDAVFLSGGSTFLPLYAQAPTSRAHFFLADERYVTQDDTANIYKTISDLYLSRCPEVQLTAPNVALPVAEAAAHYETVLRAWQEQGGQFSAAVLGIGSDGHTASLFPKQYAGLENRPEWVLPVEAELPPIVHRITITPTLIHEVKELIFVAVGEIKRDIIRQIVEKQADLPVTHFLAGATLYLDKAAAADIAPNHYEQN